MTGPRFTPDPAELPPHALVDPEIRTGAGSPAALRVMVTNRAAEPRVIAVTGLGLDATWLPLPIRSRPVMPGESIALDVTVAPAAGTVAARYPFAIAVEALDPASGSAAVATTLVDVLLIVDEPSAIAIGLDPVTATAVFQRRVTLTVHNSGPTPASVNLEARSPASSQIQLGASELVVGPGQTVPVRATVRVARPRIFGQRARHTYTVTARSAGAPRHVEGSLVVRAVLGPAGTKAVAMLAVVAVWVALALIFIPKLSNHVKSGQNVAAKTATSSAAGGAGQSGAPSGSTKSGTGKSGGKSGGGKSGGAKSGATGAAGGAGTDSAAAAVQLNGTVTGDSPGDVHVAIAPTSLVDENAEGATPVGFTTASLGPVGKVPEGAVLLTAARTVSQNRAITTGADGAWAFPSVRAPGYYLLTFTKTGYQTQRYVVDSSAQIATQPLKVLLVSGQGSLHGSVTGPSGPVGAAQITITDGTNTITASSNSTGDVGSWSVSGLSTPSSYVVTATKDGMSTESQLVNLGAGGSSTVGLKLAAGVATLGGTVKGPDSTGALTGLGNVTVTVTDGTTPRTATTVTTGSLRGEYTLPGLVPGVYTITIQATGYMTQTRQVTIAKGMSAATVNASLNSSAATVTGVVQGAQFDDQTGAPLTQGGTFVMGPVNGAGLTLTSATNTYKITSSADGSFRFNGVAPGTYVLSAQYSGLITSYQTVTAVVGESNKPVTFTLQPEINANTSTITGYVGSATTSGGTLSCADPTKSASASPSSSPATPSASPSGSTAPTTCSIFFTLTDSDLAPVLIHLKDGDPYLATSTATPAASGPTPYTLSAEQGLAPGLYHLTIGSTGYLPATITIRVPLNGIATAPQVNLYPANIISGTINALGNVTTDLAGKTYSNCVWAIPEGFSDPTGKITQPPTSCPTGDAAPAQDGCSSLGHAAPGLSIIAADDTYSIGGLCDGTYKVYVFMQNPTYVSPAIAAVETVSHGQTLDYSPHVTRKARVVLNFRKLVPGTGAISTDTGGMTISTVACTPATPDAIAAATAGKIVTDSVGRLIVSGLDSGSSGACVASVSAADSPTGKPMTGSVTGLSLAADSDTSATITLTQGLGTVIGRVVSPYGTRADNPVKDATVTLVGTVGYNGSDPSLSDPVDVKTNPEGCFAIVHDAGSATVTPPAVCGDGSDLTIAAGTVKVLPLVNPSTSVSVAATDGTRPFQAQLALDPASLSTVTVQPLPASTSALKITATDPASVNLAPVSIRVTGTLPIGAGTVSVSTDSAGNLLWSDSNLAAVNQAWPGTYTLTASLPGYSDATATVNCPLPATGGPACAFDAPFVLTALGVLSGTVFGKDGGTGASQPLSGATVTATCVAGSLAPCATAGAQIQATTDASGHYSFTGTATHYFMARTQWNLSISATGYVDGTASTTVANGENSQNVTLDALGTLFGTISGNDPGRTVKQQPLPGATVTLTCVTAGSRAPCAAGTTSINAVTDSSGHYSFAGSSVPYFMATGTTWQLAVSATGYVDKSDSAQIGSGTNSDNVTLDALGTVSGNITGLTAGSTDAAPLPGAIVTITCLAGSQAPCGSAGSTQSVVADSAGYYSFQGSASPYFMAAGDWTFKVAATGYSTNTFGAEKIVSGTNVLPLQLNALGALSGTVTGFGGTPLSGAKVTATCANADASSPPCPTAAIVTTTDLSGGYTLTGSATNFTLPLADWTLAVTATGYLDGSATKTVVSGANTQNVQLTARGALSGTITGQGGAALSGATVTATCVTGTAGSPVVACGSGESFNATTDSSGHYTIPGTGSTYAMTPGAWTVTASALSLGYTSQRLVDPTAGATTLTIAPGPNTKDGVLLPLGSLSGSVNGLLAKPAAGDQSQFTQRLSGAKVSIEPCTGAKSTCPSGDVVAADAAASTVTTDTNGAYSFAGASTPYVLAPGGYRITVRAFGYQTQTSAIDVTAGANTPDPITLPVRPVDLPIGIQIDAAGTLTVHATIKLVRVDDATTSITLDKTDADSSKVFHTPSPDFLIPATYRVTVTGDSSSVGSSILATVATITVPLSNTGTAAEADIPVTVVQNTVTGVVTGPSGQSGTANLGGVTAELGTLDTSTTPATFVPSPGANGNDLVATSAATTGAFTFTGVPNGTYVARLNHVSPINGYGSATTAAVTVGYGQTAALPSTPLPRVTRDVTVHITTSDANDNLSGVTVSLTGASEHGWQFQASNPSHAAGSTSWAWDLGQVPFGNWTLTVPLPADHYGTLTPSSTSGGPAMSCGSSSPITCTSGTVTVSGDSTSSAGLAANYDLTEYQPSIAVTASALALDTAPTTVTLTVGSLSPDSSYPVSTGASPTPAALPVWLNADTTITASVGKSGWADQHFDATSAAHSATIALTEVGGSVTVSASSTPAYTGNATITLAAPSGFSAPPAQSVASGGTVTFSDIPYGSGWSAHATVTYTVADVPAHGGVADVPAHDVTVSGDSTTFSVAAGSPSGTVNVPMS